MSCVFCMIWSAVSASNLDLRIKNPTGWTKKQTQPNPLRLSLVDSEIYQSLNQSKPIGAKLRFFNFLQGKNGRFSRNMDGAHAHYSRLARPKRKRETGKWKLEPGRRKLENGKWKPEAGNGHPESRQKIRSFSSLAGLRCRNNQDLEERI